MKAMRCRYSEAAMKVVHSYLRRTGQTLRFCDGGYSLSEGAPNIETIEQAFRHGAIQLAGDGSIMICGTDIPPQWDTVKIRRRIEDHLRKSASKGDIIRIAACLGVKMR
ncbi:MAG: hypothetical protein EHM79_13670 [Geobacter sp.]|nr:MAG: hypothetical protein EHM79_13670 [Geobacter sp.]